MIAEPVGEISVEARNDLRVALEHAYSAFEFYRRRFDDAGVTRRDIEDEDPFAVLGRIPLLRGECLHDLTNECIAVAGEVIDIETSSGTTGRRKRRPITYYDDATENALLVRMLRACGVGGDDRVACVDIGPLTLMVSFTRALDDLGAAESYAYGVGPDVEATIGGMFTLDPSVIVTIPSVLDRCIGPLRRWLSADPRPGLDKVIYVGEPMAQGTRRVLTEELGLEVFGYYGASETSALGIECAHHDGIHLFNDGAVFEVAAPDGGVGELLVTTLRQQGLPLVRYALGDLIEVRHGQCPCGLPYPRIHIAGRKDGAASVLGVKLSYAAVRDAALWGLGDPRPIEVVLSGDGREKMTVIMPEAVKESASKIRKSLSTREPDLAYLVAGGFLELDLVFVDDAHFGNARKLHRILDRRGAANDAAR